MGAISILIDYSSISFPGARSNSFSIFSPGGAGGETGKKGGKKLCIHFLAFVLYYIKLSFGGHGSSADFPCISPLRRAPHGQIIDRTISYLPDQDTTKPLAA
jgi:hypothetical protein